MRSSQSNVGGAVIDDRGSEQQLLNALTGKYGVDNSTREARVPQHMRNVYELQLTDGNSVRETSRRQGAALVGKELISQLMLAHMEVSGLIRVSDDLRREMKAFGVDETYYITTQSPIPFLASANAVLPISMSGSSGVIATSKRQVGDGSDSSAHVDPSHSLVASNARMAVHSPLASLMCPLGASRSLIDQLMLDTRIKISRYCPTIPQDAALRNVLVAAYEQPMWSEPPQDALLLQRNPSSSRVIAATMNQLIEELTQVYINPVANRSSQRQSVDDVFLVSFLTTYRSFMPPQVLLAKLFQRFHVPAFFHIGDMHEGHGITHIGAIGIPPTQLRSGGIDGSTYSQRTSRWLKVQQCVKERVLCILCVWLRQMPHHFDEAMLQACLVFVDEQCYLPNASADCPASLMQAAEFVKFYAASVLMHGSGAVASMYDPSLPPTLTYMATPSSPGAAETTSGSWPAGFREVPKFLRDSLDDYVSLAGASCSTLVAPSSSRSNGGDTTSSSISTAVAPLIVSYTTQHQVHQCVHDFLAMQVPHMANHITASCHFLFRSFRAECIIELAFNNNGSGISLRRGGSSSSESGGGGGGLQGSAAEDRSNVERFLSHAERLTYWATSLLLFAAYLDVRGSPAAPSSSSQQQQFPLLGSTLLRLVELATHLIETNDMHSAFGIAAGINHPAVSRLHKPIISLRFLFHDRVENLIRFFQLDTAQYSNYMLELPDDDKHPPVPLLHVVIDEMRSLLGQEASFFNTASAGSRKYVAGGSGDGSTLTAAAEGPLLQWEPSRVLVHWRKFQALATMVHDMERFQKQPIPHNMHAYMEQSGATVAASRQHHHQGGDPSFGGLATPHRRQLQNTNNTMRKATESQLVSVGEALEESQFRHMVCTDPKLLVGLSFLVLPAAHE